MAENTALPLARYSVLDLTRARAGPTCVRQLVDWGARAIKIEMPGGRSGDGMGGNRHAVLQRVQQLVPAEALTGARGQQNRGDKLLISCHIAIDYSGTSPGAHETFDTDTVRA